MKILYLGTDPSAFLKKQKDCNQVIHYPILKIVPLPIPKDFSGIACYTHLVFTSKNAVSLFLQMVPCLEGATIIAIGQETKRFLEEKGQKVDLVAEEETQEGIISLLASFQNHEKLHILLPRSLLARPLLTQYLLQHNIPFRELFLYTVCLNPNLPFLDLAEIDAIYFTSPSTVFCFIEKFGKLPQDKKLIAIGQVTQACLENAQKECSHDLSIT